MTITNFPAGTYGLDSAVASTSLGIATAKQTGAAFWNRYSAGAGDSSPSSQFKLAQPGEAAALAAGGIELQANMEWSETEPLNGYNAGLADGQADLAFWKGRGLAQGKTIRVSLEPGNTIAQVPQIEQYLAGYNAGLAGYYFGDGFYAGIPDLLDLMNAGIVKVGWIPESTSASGIPETYSWIYQPTKAQLAPAMTYLDGLIASAPAGCSFVWQNGNKWFSNRADENIVLKAADGTSITNPGPVLTGGGMPLPAPSPAGPYEHASWPGPQFDWHNGDGNCFANINGPATWHGGWNAKEQVYVKMIQQRLEYLRLVPGHNGPDGWADGIFDVKGNGQLTGPTTDAVTAFQRKYRAKSTSIWGRVFSDDWATLFSVHP
jgi:hypothetical protein